MSHEQDTAPVTTNREANQRQQQQQREEQQRQCEQQARTNNTSPSTANTKAPTKCAANNKQSTSPTSTTVQHSKNDNDQRNKCKNKKKNAKVSDGEGGNSKRMPLPLSPTTINKDVFNKSLDNVQGSQQDVVQQPPGITDSSTSAENRIDCVVNSGVDGELVVSTNGLSDTGQLQQSQNSNENLDNSSSNQQLDRKKKVSNCCFCWCCCCSLSCLTVKNNDENNSRSKESNKLDNLNGEFASLPSLEDIRDWGESFEKLMKCPAGREIFRDFLKGEYSEENIMFWLACEELKSETNPVLVEEKARIIYEDYISILSPKEVSLDARVRDIINRNMVEPMPHTFDEAQLQIYTLMHRDSYPRFVNSNVYRRLAQLPVSSRKDSAASHP